MGGSGGRVGGFHCDSHLGVGDHRQRPLLHPPHLLHLRLSLPRRTSGTHRRSRHRPFRKVSLLRRPGMAIRSLINKKKKNHSGRQLE